MEKLRKEAAYEARVVQRLRDNPGIPLLFGVMLQQPIVALVFQFHGENDKSLTLYKATKEKSFTENQVWNRVSREVAEALNHIHGFGFIHNDLKSNNVVVEQREGHPSPVIVLISVRVCWQKKQKYPERNQSISAASFLTSLRN